jgi:hypothetical protein
LEFEGWLRVLEPAERELAWLRFVEGLSTQNWRRSSMCAGTIKSRFFT